MKTIFVIEKEMCRGESLINKYKGDQQKVISHCSDILSKLHQYDDEEEMFGVIGDHLESISSSEGVIVELLMQGCQFDIENSTEPSSLINLIQQKINIVKDGGSIETDESIVGIGLSPKQAMINMIEFDLDVLDEDNWE